MSKILWSMLIGFIEGIIIWHCVLYPVILKKKCIELLQYLVLEYRINVDTLHKKPHESYRKYYRRLYLLSYQLSVLSAF